MATFEIDGKVVFAVSAIAAIRQVVADVEEIAYLTTDADGRYSQYCVNDELVTVYTLKD